LRKIPATMATQHPDNATAPYFEPAKPFIGVHDEMTEAVLCFKDLGADEYMWDWEGKHADAAVIDRLFSEYYEYFSQNQLGHNQFLTFRLPNIWEEKGYNLLQAMTVILSSEDFARDLQFKKRPLFEVILPMTVKADQLMHMQKLFQKVAKFKSEEFTSDNESNTDYLEIIPLVESSESQMSVDTLLDDYVQKHVEFFGKKPEYIRCFLACSDSSLTSGQLAGMIGNKLGLARMYEFSAKQKIPVYPIFGPGSLLFRGGLTPDSVERFVQEYPGVRTVTIQSAFRYDFPLQVVKRSVAKLQTSLPKTKPLKISEQKQTVLEEIAAISSKFYKKSLDSIIGDVNHVFEAFPKRRDRRQHIGLLAYSRTTGKHPLPRAITFTGGMYSIGVPPEFIGLGRTLEKLTDHQLDVLLEEYSHIKSDFAKVASFLNMQNLALLTKNNSAWQDVLHDIKYAQRILGFEIGPNTSEEKAHYELSTAVLEAKNKEEISKLINEMAALRHSLG